MKNPSIKKLFSSIIDGQKKILNLTPKDKAKLERGWDIEHAYYSSSLEGSKIDRKDFEELAKGVS